MTKSIQLNEVCCMAISINRIIRDGRATQRTRSFSVEPGRDACLTKNMLTMKSNRCSIFFMANGTYTAGCNQLFLRRRYSKTLHKERHYYTIWSCHSMTILTLNLQLYFYPLCLQSGSFMPSPSSFTILDFQKNLKKFRVFIILSNCFLDYFRKNRTPSFIISKKFES